MKDLFDKKQDCCGCEACANVCPQQIIQMRSDEEGFFYPSIIDLEKCVDCGRCKSVCPVKNVHVIDGFTESGIAGYSVSNEEVLSSASGGLATALGKEIISLGGVVYGVLYSEDCTDILYGRADSLEQLEKFKTSKYAQARKYYIYKQILDDLKNGLKVLFIGLPCEVNALRLFLNKEFENLYICSLICHGPTSPAVHKQYCYKLSETNTSGLSGFSVRYKLKGWKPYFIRAQFKDGNEHVEQFSSSTYGKAFLYMKRPSCNVCKIKRSAINSDITIGDYHLAADGKHLPYNPNGVSSAMIHTAKGKAIIDGLKDFYYEEVPVRNVLYSGAYSNAIPAKRNRKEFGRVFADKGLDSACDLRSCKIIESEEIFQNSIRRAGSKVKKLLKGKR